jgi:hypothetical protein
MVGSTENYGILRGAILVAADLSDFFPKSSHLRSRPSRSDRMQASQRSQVAMSELRQKAHLKQRIFDVCSSVKPPPLNLTSNLNQRFFLRGTVAALPSSHRSRR